MRMRSEHDFYVMQWDDKDDGPLSTDYSCKLCNRRFRIADMMALHLAEHALQRQGSELLV